MKDSGYAVEVQNWNDKVQEALYNSNSRRYKLLERGMTKSDQFVFASYSFGDTLMKLGDFHLPLIDGGSHLYNKINVSRSLLNVLGEDLTMTPFGLVLSGCFSVSADSNQRLYPLAIMETDGTPGIRKLYRSNQYNFKHSWTMNAGSQYLCLLPNIKDNLRYKRLQRHYTISPQIPRNFTEQLSLFRDVARSYTTKWQAKLLFFSQKTLRKINEDKAFSPWREDLIKVLAEQDYFDKDRLLFDFMWEEFIQHQENKGFKEKSYIYNIAKHLLLVAIGEAFAFVPAESDNMAPIKKLSKAFIESYKLHYAPTFMTAARLLPENGINSVYYSLQYPLHLNPSLGKRNFSMESDLDDIRNIKFVHDRFSDYVNSSVGRFIQDSVISNALKTFRFEYFHNVKDRLKIVKDCRSIIDTDKRFLKTTKSSGLPFCYSSHFFQGCIRITNII